MNESTNPTYTLMSIDTGGNVLWEREIDPHDVIGILARDVKALVPLVESTPQEIVVQPSPAPGKPIKVKQEKSAGHGPTEAMKEDILAGMATPDIAKKHNVKMSTVYNLRYYMKKQGELDGAPVTKRGKIDHDSDGGLPKDTKRSGTMTVAKYEQVKIATHHQLPEDSIARNMGLTVKEVHKAVMSRTYEEYCS